MKKKITSILLVMLVVLVAVSVLVSCGGKQNTKTITIQNGDTVIGTATVESGSTITIDALKAATTVSGNDEIVGFYTDKELTQAFVAENEITTDVTLYVKLAAKTYYISVQSNGGSKVEKVAVAKGSDYTVPVPEKEGYDFAGYTYLDDDANPQAFATTGKYNFDYNTILTANWTIKKYTVSFYDGEDKIAEDQVVEHGSKATIAAASKAGYDFGGWAEKDAEEAFDVNAAITSDVTLYAIFTPHLYTITVEGWHAASVTVRYGETYTLADPEDEEDELIAEKVGTGADKEWLTFTGYTYNETTFPSTGVYTYTQNITVAPVYTANPDYTKVTVTFWDTLANSAFGEVKVLPGEAATLPASNVTDKVAYDFVGWYTTATFDEGTEFTAATAVNATMKVYAKYAPKVFNIIVKDTDANGTVLDTVPVEYLGAYELDTNIEKLGYTFVGYVYNNAEFAASGASYTYTSDIEVYAIFELADDGNFVIADNYFKERANAEDPYTYVFLVGATYTFTGYEITSAADETLININAAKDKFTAAAVGTYTFTATKLADNTVTTKTAKNVYDIANMEFFGDYSDMIANANNNSSFQTNVTEANYVMTIGKDNFIPELSIQNAALATITLEQANVEITANVANFDYDLSGNSITFDEAYTGNVELTFAPKYTFDTNMKATLTVNMNEGVNVYDNATLKAAYSNNNVQTINVLRNVIAEFDLADYRADCPKGTGSISLTKTDGTVEVINNVDTGSPKNWYGGGVYRRTTTNKNDNLVINGNYFTIDGTKLPYLSNVSEIGDMVGYHVGDVQIGIFLYRCAWVSGAQCNPEAGVRERDSANFNDIYVMYSDGQATFNNLKVVGNSRQDHVGSTITGVQVDNKPYLKMSYALNGIVVRGGTANLNNVTVTNTGIGLFMTGGVSGYDDPGLNRYVGNTLVSGVAGQVQDGETQATKANLNSCIIDYSWADSSYNYDLVALTIANSRFGSSSGPAIHFDDRPYGGSNDGSCGFSNLNCQLKMDQYTAAHINNWVAGTEPWFVAYNQTSNATVIKSGLEAGANHSHMTILRGEAFSEVEKMNFSIVIRQTADGKAAAWAADNHTGIYLDVQAIKNTVQQSGPKVDSVFFYGDNTEYATVGYKLQNPSGLSDIIDCNPFLCAYTGVVDVYIRAYAQ